MNEFILLADDDPDDCDFFNEAVMNLHESHECACVLDGRAALEAIPTFAQTPDLIFLDINMPRMGGWDCLKELRKDPSLNATWIVIYSTSWREEDTVKMNTLGGNVFLKKPVSLDVLSNEIETIIANRRRAG